MLFKLSIKNMKKSFKDYAIYFFTLILGVALFYVFNALDSQSAMLVLSSSKQEIMRLMTEVLGGLSVFVAFVLGFLIIYANQFLVKRRKKEFGVYMTLGMGKGSISKILFIETLLIGVLSLMVGLGLGVFVSQIMSVVIANLFEADMSSFQFVVSNGAIWKTVLYFGITYLLVMFFNTFSISKCKLIDLLNAKKKNEEIKLPHPMISIFLFLLSAGLLSYAYYQVTVKAYQISVEHMLVCMVMGAVGTYLFFRSLAGFILQLLQKCRRIYLRGLNAFVLRQVNSQVNTTVFSMTIICLLLFLTIGVFSTAVSLKDMTSKDLKHLVRADILMHKGFTSSTKSVVEEVTSRGVDLDVYFSSYTTIPTYDLGITNRETLGEKAYDEIKEEFNGYRGDDAEEFVAISDYNRLAEFYGIPTYQLKDDEYIIVANYPMLVETRNRALAAQVKITIDGKEYRPKYDSCQDGYIQMSANPSNGGVIIVPDAAVKDKSLKREYLAANYKETEESKQEQLDTELIQKIHVEPIHIIMDTRLDIYAASIGLGAIVTFIGLYLGIIFLISSAAILALKQLSDSSDNKDRYQILRRMGTDNKMIHRALFIQIAIFFLLPLLLAAVHSIFGIQFAHKALFSIGNIDILSSIVMTAMFLIAIYGSYFLITYFCSKTMISE